MGEGVNPGKWNSFLGREDLGPVVKEDLVDDSGRQGHPIHGCAAFDHHARNLQLSQTLEDRMNVWTLVSGSGQLFDAYSTRFQCLLLRFITGRTENQHIALESTCIPNALHQPRFQRQPQLRIQNDTQERTSARFAATVGEQGVVSDDSSNSYHDGVPLMSLFVNVAPCGFAGDPPTSRDPCRFLGSKTARRGNLAVERHRGLECYERNAMANIACEGFIEAMRFRLQTSNFHMHARRTQFVETLPAYLGIGIGHGRNHAINPSGDQSVRARRRAALMRMWFEIDVERSAASFATGLLESEHFGVLDPTVGVNAGTCDFALGINNDRADIRIG